jgi:hypothetical protein
MEICRNPHIPVLIGYICAMSWGNQDKGPGGKQRVKDAWGNRDSIKNNLNSLRSAKLSRSASYNLFFGKCLVPGIGPAFLTKLLFFFNSY